MGYRMLKNLISVVVAMALLCSLSTRAATTSPEQVKPAEVHIGIYANQLLGMSIKDNNFDIDYYLWLRWKDPELKPNSSIELLNGRQSCQTIAEEQKKDWFYVTLRCVSKVTRFWDLSRFPLDDQVLELVFEDNNNDIAALKYIPDTPNSNISKVFNVSGWKVGELYTADSKVKCNTLVFNG